MNHAFSQMVAIFVSVFLFFGIPFVYACERQETARQYFVLSESITLVDSVCNTGFLSKEMYESFVRTLSNEREVYEISLTLKRDRLHLDEDGRIRIYGEYYSEEDLLPVLEEEESLFFQKGDELRICVKRIAGGLPLPFETKEAVLAYYGSLVKYEVDETKAVGRQDEI